MESKQIIGNNIRYFRDKLGLSQNELANYLSIKRELISYYENGKRYIPVTALNKLANLFGVELDELFEEDNKIQNVNLAFAFRSDYLKPSDLENIASFKRVVLNYFKMLKLNK